MNRKGFSLLELMITLAIAAIITMYALPAYRAHVAKTHRMDAAAALMRAVQFIETARLAQTPGTTDTTTLPTGIDQTPSNGAAIYKLAIQPESATNGGYSIEAAPVASGAMDNDACGTFIIDATGLRSNRTTTVLDTTQSFACWAGKG
jgi:type IV pilus assembly protein PilE